MFTEMNLDRHINDIYTIIYVFVQFQESFVAQRVRCMAVVRDPGLKSWDYFNKMFTKFIYEYSIIK